MKKNRIILSLILGIVFSSYGQTNKIENTGNVGIGTTSPLSPLQINSNSDDVLTFKTLDNNWLYTNWMDNTNKRRTWMGLGSDLSSFNITTQNGTNKILFNGGNVGIGTTNPTNILNIEKNQNGSTLLEINNNNNGNSARRGIIIGEGTPGKSVYLLSTSANYNQVDTWANAGVLGTDSQLSNGLIVRSASGKIRFQPNGISDKIVFDETGNVGVGTTNPSVALDVSGTSKGIKLGDTNGSLLFRNNVSGANEIRSYGLPLEIETRDTQDISFNSNNGNSKLMTIKGDGSGIGIGTTNPSGKLEILKNADLSNAITLPNSGLIIRADNNGSDASLRFGVDNTNLKAVIQTQQTTTATKFDLLINPFGGHVGIGTTTPDAKLAVNGTIHSKEVKVDLVGWPDYVFENNYNLATLKEVEKHIAEKGHLENIPSAETVAENGIQLGEMNAKLLQKIEELTLYMIEQNKKTEKLIKEVEVLKQKNADLEKKIK
ncbi:hypothetical protein [uncultured Aquimarina sp.]|uniref:hypothetical protein n=1 Tax=uncultured Aquimarina sp. TaxID=575652 RepID=UPI0026295B06|nr:hypothetical protein [uncultured Aquimarina sp.]